MTEALARTLRPQGVGVSVLCPGRVVTNLGETARVSGVPDDRRSEWSYFPPEMLDAIEPESVGPMVCDAIIEHRFTIFTHEHDAERFRTWHVDIEQSLTDAIDGAPHPPRLS